MEVILKHACRFGAKHALKKESMRIHAASALGETTGTSATKVHHYGEYLKFNLS